MNNFSKEWIQSIFKMTGKCKNVLTKKILLDMGFQKTFKIINIVGTNGKGSISQYINDALIKKGFKVGKFTSPHLFKYNERITINNIPISDESFFNIINPNIKIFQKENIMFFPLTYIATMMYFYKNKVDFVILEAGVGGLEDPTNIIDGDYGLLTSISEDHLDWFKIKENISIDKSGIINKNMIFFLPKKLDRFSITTFKQKIISKKAKLIEVDNLNPDYKERNKKMANALFKHINKEDIKDFNEPFGRTSIIKKENINYIYDVAHNFDGIFETLKYLKNNNIYFDQVVLSLSKNKDDNFIYKQFDCQINIIKHSGYKAKEIEDYKKEYDNVLNSIEDIKKLKVKKGILFIGSFFLIHDILGEDFNGK